MAAWVKLANNMLQSQGIPQSEDPDAEKQRQEQQKLREKQQSDQQLSDHMNQLGAKPVIAGTVYDTEKIPDYSGETEGYDVPIARPADPSRTVKHKSAEGDAVQWELPMASEQRYRKLNDIFGKFGLSFPPNPDADQTAPGAADATPPPQQGGASGVGQPGAGVQPAAPPAQAPPAQAGTPATAPTLAAGQPVPSQQQPGAQPPAPPPAAGGDGPKPSNSGGWKGFMQKLGRPIAGTPMWQAEQEVAMQKQRAQEDAELFARDFTEHMQAKGAKNVVNGTVYDTNTDGSKYLRPADKSRTITQTLPSGEKLQWELLSKDEQPLWDARQKQLGLDQDARQKGNIALQEALGRARGTTKGKQEDLDARGVPITKDFADQYGLPDSRVGEKILPEDRETLERYLGAANIRGDAQVNSAEARAKAAKDIAAQKAAVQAQLQQEKLDWQDQQNERRLGYQDGWARARVAIAGNTQDALNNRFQLRLFDAAQTKWANAQDEADQESQKAMEAKALLDPSATRDGDEFTSPWTKTKNTMNPGWRTIIGRLANNSIERANRLTRRAQELAGRYNVGAAPAGGASGPASRAASPQGAVPRGTSTPPGNPTGGAASVKYASMDQVKAYAAKKRIDLDAAKQEFQAAGFKVR
ncbi:MAG: hypothetical protein ABSF22_25570 [Bryobacteraceae bacterium]